MNIERLITELSSKVDENLTYIEALVDYAEENDIDVESLGAIINKNPVLKVKVYENSVKYRLVDEIENEGIEFVG